MFTDEDKKYLSDPAYNLALEKFYDISYYKEQNGRNGTLSQAYAFSNEKLHNIFKHLRKKSPRVLTVGSSGDQLLYSLYYGSKDITLIDANLYSQYWIEYKMAAIKNLEFEEFKKYFLVDEFDTEFNPFNNNVFPKIFHDLSDESKVFWGQIFLNGYSPEQIYQNIIKRKDSHTDRVYSIFYKEENSYNKVQEILLRQNYKINFINEEFLKFHSVVQGKFDIILLSNIRRYVNDVSFMTTVNGLYDKHLNNGGIIQLHYDYFNPRGKKNPKFKSLFPKKQIVGFEFKDKHYTYLMYKPRWGKNNDSDPEKGDEE